MLNDDAWELKVAGYDPYRDSENYYYDPVEAEKPIKFCEANLNHVKGRKGPLLLSDFHKRITRNIYGWKHKETGARRYRNVFLFTPRKNAKSTYAAFLAIWELLFTGEVGPEVAIAATDRDQASLIFEIIEGFCYQNPKLKKRVNLLPSRKRIVSKKNRGYLVAIASDAASAHGMNLSSCFVDELHSFRDREFYDVLKTSQAARDNPLFVVTTTAGYEQESICRYEYDYAKDVRAGLVDDPRYLPVICEADENQDWTSVEAQKTANPLYGVSISSDFLAEHCRKAQEQPSYQLTYERLYLNRWTNNETIFIRPADWKLCVGPEPANLDLHECWAFVDLSTVLDLTAFSICWYIDGVWTYKNWCWMPGESRTLKDKKYQNSYMGWEKDPLANLKIFDGERKIDEDEVAAKIVELCEQYNVRGVGYDPYHFNLINKKLKDAGVKTILVAQNYANMSQAIKDFEAAVIDGNVNHLANPLTAWQVGHAAIRSDQDGNIKLIKPNYYAPKKIDSVICMVGSMQLHRISRGAVTVSV